MNDEKGRVEAMNDTLNSRTRYRGPEDEHTPISEVEAPETEDHWNSKSIDDLLASDRRRGERRSLARPILNRVFFVAAFFFLAAGGVAAYIYFAGANFISSKNVDITVRGPVSISAGDILTLDITITNKNNADLDLANLNITYPDGTRDPVDISKPLTYTKEALGTLASGKEITKSERAVIYGEQGVVKEITLSLDYKVKGSNAIFNKEKLYDISVGSVPVSIQITEPQNVTSGIPFDTSITLTTNSTETLKNVILRGEYPYGFSVVSSDPAALNDGKNLWSLGDLAPESKKTIILRGTLSGQDLEERTFRFSAGVSDGIDPAHFATSLATVSQTVSINRPSVGLELTLNGDSSAPYVAPAGKSINGSIKFTNNLSGKLLHAKVVVKLSGSALDRFSVMPGANGFYDSNNNAIIWDETTDPNLAEVLAGEGGLFSFQFASLPSQTGPGSNNKNQEIDLAASVNGTPIGSSQINVADSRIVKIASTATLAVTPFYSKGPFKNTGAIPPKAEKPTTYTIITDLKNTQNDISKAKVTMILGSNVTWMGNVSPTGENITYDPATKIVTWNFDTLASGAGFTAPVKEGIFQVSLTPSIGQIGSVPILVSSVAFNGQDAFTNTNVNLTLPQVTTRIATDPKYVQGDETVVK